MYGDDPMVSVLMARSSEGKDVKAEKSNVCEWVKLPAPSTVHIHPSLLGSKEPPDTGGPYDDGSGVADDGGDADLDAEAGEGAAEGEAEAGLETPQLPKAD